MKLWMVLPSKPDVLNKADIGYFGYSTAAMCPPLTVEMYQDGLAWYEVEVLRKVPQLVQMRYMA